MNELQMRQQTYELLNNAVASLISQGVSFTMMEDTLYRILVEIKDGAQREFLASVTSSPEESEGEEKEEE